MDAWDSFTYVSLRRDNEDLAVGFNSITPMHFISLHSTTVGMPVQFKEILNLAAESVTTAIGVIMNGCFQFLW
jgi:hypothetical protein